MRNRFVAAVLSVLVPLPAAAVGLEVQGYPAGVIVDVGHALRLGDANGITFLTGWNLTDRRDFGRHDDEHGGGPGFAGAWWRWAGAARTGWGFGARADLWFLTIDWENDAAGSGSTNVVVLQPTARGGYAWQTNGRLRVEAAVSLGAEINVSTEGEDVGEGTILLAGVAVSL